ncbi:MAG: polyphosphate:AMP phosphotransferase [Acidobacteria bacterium]|nr:polyphosphate:AMP phosphotransferase [Acidobacteriota bacterium]
MFETAEVGNRIDKKAFNREAPEVREALLKAQKELASAGFSVIVHIGGVEGAGKSETVNHLLAWMDARGIQTHAIWESTDEERERPPMWRFWRLLPASGRIGIFLGSWYTAPIIDRVFGRLSAAGMDQSLDRIVEFERMLAEENVLLVKFWMHLSKEAQEARLRSLEASKRTRWRVRKVDWKFFKRYDAFRSVSEHALRKTGTGSAPWHIVEAEDERYRSLTVSKILLAAIAGRLAAAKAHPGKKAAAPPLPKPARPNVISRLDLTRAITDREYERRLEGRERDLNRLTRRLYDCRRSMILVFEGPDAAGKGGTIRRLTSCMDARLYQVISVAAPTDEERARPYLWRFWRHLPRLGRVTIYDRSWYGRVLVERIEGFCEAGDWQRAYAEINAFEEQLTSFGTIVLKFWLAIGADEQLRRFKDRETTPYKQYKITEEDWRNRKRWDAYEAAACDMIERTSTEAAPWVPVEANDKNWARVKVMKTVARRLERELGG